MKVKKNSIIMKKVWKNMPYLFFIFLEYFFLKVYKIQRYGNTYNIRKINKKNKGEIKMEIGTVLI